ncbi:hypothetical protein QYE76_071599 [Lolium multiflorum]|uniref:F-box/LRR-repeat protein 15/At3g58940/PEG3-like LRR domain-containing protein n=1 Tax=Lolium multiflorum TaxID=4521 RepID=A0AAD8WGZ7_LOLMU|nr:hypothetical protein QYE76_071599 [Lolium multiflorum]
MSAPAGDLGAPAPAGAPAASSHPPSPRTSHQNLPEPPLLLLGDASNLPTPAETSLTGSPSSGPLPAQGFLSARTPRRLALDPLALPPPFVTPGDAFLQLALEDFCTLRRDRAVMADVGKSDLISALPDDLLLQVLGRLPLTAAAARTSLLSRRDAAVGPGVPFLDIAFDSAQAAAGVDDGFTRDGLQKRVLAGLPSLLHAAAGLSPVEFHLALPRRLDGADVELPPFHRATSMHLYALNLRLKLPPSTCGFPKLETLSLSGYRVDLAELVRHCPCLRVLRVTQATLGADINIRSESLQKLFLRTNETRRWTDSINVEAPKLKRLTLLFGTDTGARLSVSLVAPVHHFWRRYHGAAQSLGQRVTTCAGKDSWSSQLSNVNGPVHAQLNFQQQIEKHLVTDFSVLDLTMVYDDLSGSHRHGFGPFVLHLLEMHRIRAATRRLQIQFLRYEVKEKCPVNCPCDEPKNWRSKDISLINLEEVEIKGFVGEDHGFDFLRVIFRCAPMLKKMWVRVSGEATTGNDWCTTMHELT